MAIVKRDEKRDAAQFNEFLKTQGLDKSVKNSEEFFQDAVYRIAPLNLPPNNVVANSLKGEIITKLQQLKKTIERTAPEFEDIYKTIFNMIYAAEFVQPAPPKESDYANLVKAIVFEETCQANIVKLKAHRSKLSEEAVRTSENIKKVEEQALHGSKLIKSILHHGTFPPADFEEIKRLVHPLVKLWLNEIGANPKVITLWVTREEYREMQKLEQWMQHESMLMEGIPLDWKEDWKLKKFNDLLGTDFKPKEFDEIQVEVSDGLVVRTNSPELNERFKKLPEVKQ